MLETGSDPSIFMNHKSNSRSDVDEAHMAALAPVLPRSFGPFSEQDDGNGVIESLNSGLTMISNLSSAVV